MFFSIRFNLFFRTDFFCFAFFWQFVFAFIIFYQYEQIILKFRLIFSSWTIFCFRIVQKSWNLSNKIFYRSVSIRKKSAIENRKNFWNYLNFVTRRSRIRFFHIYQIFVFRNWKIFKIRHCWYCFLIFFSRFDPLNCHISRNDSIHQNQKEKTQKKTNNIRLFAIFEDFTITEIDFKYIVRHVENSRKIVEFFQFNEKRHSDYCHVDVYYFHTKCCRENEYFDSESLFKKLFQNHECEFFRFQIRKIVRFWRCRSNKQKRVLLKCVHVREKNKKRNDYIRNRND